MAGYSGKPLAEKLGIKPGFTIHLVDAPPGYSQLVQPLPEGVILTSTLSGNTDLVHLFTTQKAKLATSLRALRTKIKPDAVIWVSWPKKSSKVETDITEDAIREVALPIGFVDIKVCAVSEVWSGLKLVVRKQLR